jgi:hypothetical protein
VQDWELLLPGLPPVCVPEPAVAGPHQHRVPWAYLAQAGCQALLDILALLTWSEPVLFADFLPEFYFVDFFTLSQGFSFIKVNSYTYVQKELFSGLQLTNLGEFTLKYVGVLSSLKFGSPAENSCNSDQSALDDKENTFFYKKSQNVGNLAFKKNQWKWELSCNSIYQNWKNEMKILTCSFFVLILCKYIGGSDRSQMGPTGPMYFVFCRLYPPPPSHTVLYRRCGLAYPYDWRGFVRTEKKTSCGLLNLIPRWMGSTPLPLSSLATEMHDHPLSLPHEKKGWMIQIEGSVVD